MNSSPIPTSNNIDIQKSRSMLLGYKTNATIGFQSCSKNVAFQIWLEIKIWQEKQYTLTTEEYSLFKSLYQFSKYLKIVTEKLLNFNFSKKFNFFYLVPKVCLLFQDNFCSNLKFQFNQLSLSCIVANNAHVQWYSIIQAWTILAILK